MLVSLRGAQDPQAATKSLSLAVATTVLKERRKSQVLMLCGVSRSLIGATVACNGSLSSCLLISAWLCKLLRRDCLRQPYLGSNNQDR